ncbi:DNA endonuclease SmrA [Gallaecimonas pentaromativorans]|uniref:DNA-nicking Smr family endonuclease n=1 Tax=Gallaecimonas pentaromativorans TaxID=584787 RepID=A0A3N1P2F5_9GAMM|nr:DNA endonuclease SmrA [Gallaecimonas pentaromativorans]ROQ22645.1 DNA-nicking Smr family endonuclease [Gallaecimonas pentaromativorans]
MHDDDKSLFEKEMLGVKPISRGDHIGLAPKDANSNSKARRAAAEAELAEDLNYLSSESVELVEPHDVLSYKKAGVQDGVFKQLRQGKYDIQSVLDLHKKRFIAARSEVFDFIRTSHRIGLRTLLVLHGRGEHAQPVPALLKSYCAKWLKEMPEVLAYHSAQRHHGSTGALYVLLRKNDEQKRENFERHAKR